MAKLLVFLSLPVIFLLLVFTSLRAQNSIHNFDWISDLIQKNEFLSSITVSDNNGEQKLLIDWTINPEWQRYFCSLIRSSGANLGAGIVLDVQSGYILASCQLSSLKSGVFPSDYGAFFGKFVAASLFKIVSAIILIEDFGVETQVPIFWNGSSYGLRPSFVEKVHWNRWVRRTSLSEAFAHSFNTPFARLAWDRIEDLTQLDNHMRWFGLNQIMLPKPWAQILLGSTTIPRVKDFYLGEWVSGYTPKTRVSPLLASLWVAGILNQGRVPVPIVVSRVHNSSKTFLEIKPKVLMNWPYKMDTLTKVESMLELVNSTGTGYRAFSRFQKKWSGKWRHGGKTGSLNDPLTGLKTDWYVGFIKFEDRALVAAVVLQQSSLWHLKAAQVVADFWNYLIKEHSGYLAMLPKEGITTTDASQ